MKNTQNLFLEIKTLKDFSLESIFPNPESAGDREWGSEELLG